MKTILASICAAACLATTAHAGDTAHDFNFTAIEGGELPMSGFAGKAVLVVNTASYCGYTKQYDGLQALWDARKDDGLVVLGVPSNDFGGQEPGSEDEIKEFCEVNFAINFPMTTKEPVKGKNAHPFYKWAAETYGKGAVPGWNFHKVLIAPDGSVAGAFKSGVKPSSKKLGEAIDEALGR